jgi:hypothetical protein
VKNFEDQFVLHSTELIFVNIGLKLHTIMVGACGEIFILVTQIAVMLSCQHAEGLNLSTAGMFTSLISKDFT